jgi:hypothetical protein
MHVLYLLPAEVTGELMKLIEGNFDSHKARHAAQEKKERLETIRQWVYTIAVLLCGIGLTLLGLIVVFTAAPNVNISGAFFALVFVLVIIAFGGVAAIRGIKDELAYRNDVVEQESDEES